MEQFYRLNSLLGWSTAQLSALESFYRAAKVVSLQAYQGPIDVFRAQVGRLGELVYTAAVGVPYALYRAAWFYPADFSYNVGLDVRHLWPDEPIAPNINLWLSQQPFDQDFSVIAEVFALYEEDEDELEEDEDERGPSDEELEAAKQRVEDWLPMALEEAIAQLEAVIDQLSDQVQLEVTEFIERLNLVAQAIDPMQSQFVDLSNPQQPVIPIKRPPGSGLTVLPDPSQADVAVNLQELSIYPNLFDLVGIGIHLLAAYLGADRLPRPYYPALAEAGTPEWQINNLADLVGQLHSEIREISLVDTEVRGGVGEQDQPQRIQTNLGTALGLILAALREVSLDSERSVILSAQAAQAALTSNAQLGTKTETQPLDLGFRGKVPVPVASGASIAQQLAAIETLLGAIAIQLGVSLKPSTG